MVNFYYRKLDNIKPNTHTLLDTHLETTTLTLNSARSVLLHDKNLETESAQALTFFDKALAGGKANSSLSVHIARLFVSYHFESNLL